MERGQREIEAGWISTLFFDNNKSGNIRYFKELFGYKRLAWQKIFMLPKIMQKL